ncbi:MAG: proline--tRNA ligase [Epulopiscium sp. Nuni2H_MBin003]|nr:MAG: proline--tRNA ligase [Epulopiscium sp. Nuni2H_MBin003]
MLLSKLVGEHFKEKPAEAISTSHIFLLRGGYVRQVSNGIFTMLLPAVKIKANIERILREEMNKIDGQEVIFPVVLPADLWQESGRFENVGSELLRMKDRTGKDLVLGMTHEEAAVHLARGDVKSYSQYPFMIYQIQTKFRDEARSRGGLIRVREFTMKDGYSFHTNEEDLTEYYNKCLEAYNAIYRRAGIPEVVCVEADTGMMGGNVSHEFMLLTDIGEDTVIVCDSCDYRSNLEVAISEVTNLTTTVREINEIHTPNVSTISDVANFCNTTEDNTLKTAVYSIENSNKILVIFLRGDLQVNEAKVQKIVKAKITPFTEYGKSNLKFGFIGPKDLETENLIVLYDKSIENETNLICGANKVDYHLEGLNISRDLQIEQFHDVAQVKEGSSCKHCAGKLQFKRGIEVGNIFKLGTKYTETMNMTYIDADGKSQTPTMGCYGIGVGRLLASVIEARHDQYGPIWPISIAPWQVHICVLKSKTQDLLSIGLDIYNKLQHEVILDDRQLTPGVQFADADLLGVPIRIVIGDKNLKNGQVEIVTRDKKIKKLVDLDKVIEETDKLVEELYAEYK